jgi:hypothetical protein
MPIVQFSMFLHDPLQAPERTHLKTSYSRQHLNDWLRRQMLREVFVFWEHNAIQIE